MATRSGLAQDDGKSHVVGGHQQSEYGNQRVSKGTNMATRSGLAQDDGKSQGAAGHHQPEYGNHRVPSVRQAVRLLESQCEEDDSSHSATISACNKGQETQPAVLLPELREQSRQAEKVKSSNPAGAAPVQALASMRCRGRRAKKDRSVVLEAILQKELNSCRKEQTRLQQERSRVAEADSE